MTQERIAERLDLGARHVQKIEAGDVNVTLATLLRFAEVLDVDVDVAFRSRRKPAERRGRTALRGTGE